MAEDQHSAIEEAPVFTRRRILSFESTFGRSALFPVPGVMRA
jgi:hypothetical protein